MPLDKIIKTPEIVVDFDYSPRMTIAINQRDFDLLQNMPSGFKTNFFRLFCEDLAKLWCRNPEIIGAYVAKGLGSKQLVYSKLLEIIEDGIK